MPKSMELALMKEAHKRGYGKERTGKFVYGTMRKQGWTPSTQKDVRKRAVEMLRRKRGKTA